MLSDYKRYLLKIRNSFIRSGVELSIKDIQDYEEIFYLGEKLSDLLWFYSILEISGSEDRLRGFMFPLNSYYKSSIRDKYFEDYLVYKAGYMEISASEAIKRNKLNEVKEKLVPAEEPIPIPSSVSFLEGIKSKYTEEDEEDEFIGDSEEIVEDEAFANWGSNTSDEEEEEVYSNWGNDDSEENNDLEDDEFISYSSNEENTEDIDLDDDEFISYSTEDSEDTDEVFGSWGSDEEIKTEDEEDTFSSWGSSDKEEPIEDTNDYSEDEEDAFSSWGSSDDEEDEIVDSVGETDDYDEDTFASWGSSENEDEPIVNDEDEYEEDTFSSWGSSDDEEDILSNNSDDDIEEDAYSSWGTSSDEEESTEDDYDDDAFGSWGSDEESGTNSEELERNDFGSWGGSGGTSSDIESERIGGKTLPSKKSKLDYEIESNEKTAKVIEKIANGLFSKGNLFKSKVVEKIKNMDENSD